MQIHNTKKSWGAVAVTLHWLIFALLVGQVAVGLYMTDMQDGGDKWQLYGLHKSFGVVILLFVISRVVWRIRSLIPADPVAPKWQIKAAETVILLLYLLMVAIPLSGLMMSLFGGHPVGFFDLFTIPAATKNEMFSGTMNEAHTFLSYALIAGVLLHIGAALYHHFKLKDDILRRMMPGYEDK